MAVGHIAINDQLKDGRDLARVLTALEILVSETPMLVASIQQMIDGDGSQAAHFTYATGKFGTASDAKTKEMWEELNSFYSKFSGDGSVSSVKAAFAQFLAKMG